MVVISAEPKRIVPDCDPAIHLHHSHDYYQLYFPRYGFTEYFYVIGETLHGTSLCPTSKFHLTLHIILQ